LKQQRKKFLRLTPEFAIEVLSPTDWLKDLKVKMELYIANGVQLGWLIDSDAETVHVYQPGLPVKIRRHIEELRGTGPLEGFILPLDEIWPGL
jgi:Uma2 family endonuclease